jgi:DNA-binding transcriptional LysR family regulator
MDRLRSIEIFLQVGETGSFSETSRTLNISAGSVSKHIHELEETLGARLFDRTTRNISLTEVGRLYFSRWQRIIRNIAEAEAEVSDFQKTPQGLLHIGAPMSFGNLHLLPIIPEFLERHPKMQVDLHLNDRFVSVVDGSFDVMLRISDFTDTSLIARQLSPCRHVLCASPSYLKSNGHPQLFEDLAAHRCVTYSNISRTKEWQAQRGGESIFVTVNGLVSVDNGDALKSLALAGVGIAMLPTFLVGDELRAGRLLQLLPDYQLRQLKLHANYPHRRHVPLKLRLFLDYLAEKFGPEPYWDQGLQLLP